MPGGISLSWARKFLKNTPACDIWANDVKSFGNLYVCSTLDQLITNNIRSSKEPCRLRRAIEKLCTFPLPCWRIDPLCKFRSNCDTSYLTANSLLYRWNLMLPKTSPQCYRQKMSCAKYCKIYSKERSLRRSEHLKSKFSVKLLRRKG